MGRNDDDELSEEEKARRGMAIMGLLDYIRNANNNNDDSKFKAQARGVAHTFRIQYDAFVQEGFTRDEALKMIIALISAIDIGGK